MIISAIKQQAKNPERANIFVDDKYSFSLTLDELLKERLKKGQEIEPARLKELKKLSEEGKLRMKALNWLLLRPHSVREFRDYMYRKKADPELIDALVTDFMTRSYLNDHTFAEWWYEQRSHANRSDRYIRSELMKKGIAREVIDNVLRAKTEEDGGERERLRAVIAKKGILARYQADQKKFIQYLLRQGFSYDDIKNELNAEPI